MFREKVRQLRKSKGWTQDILAERSGYSRSSIINWETGKRAPRTVDIEKLALVLGVSPRDLIEDDTSISGEGEILETSTSSKRTGGKLSTGYAYWGGVLDKAQELADSKNLREIKLIAPLLKLAYETLMSAQENIGQEVQPLTIEKPLIADMSMHGGHHNASTLSVATV